MGGLYDLQAVLLYNTYMEFRLDSYDLHYVSLQLHEVVKIKDIHRGIAFIVYFNRSWCWSPSVICKLQAV